MQFRWIYATKSIKRSIINNPIGNAIMSLHNEVSSVKTRVPRSGINSEMRQIKIKINSEIRGFPQVNAIISNPKFSCLILVFNLILFLFVIIIIIIVIL